METMHTNLPPSLLGRHPVKGSPTSTHSSSHSSRKNSAKADKANHADSLLLKPIASTTFPMSTISTASAAIEHPNTPEKLTQPEPKAEEKVSVESHPSVGIPRQVGIVAGVAIAVTGGTISQVVNQAPEYEGKFQLTVQTAPTRDTEAIGTPQIEDTNQIITDTHVRILESPRLLDPIIEQLQAENPELDFHAFTENLNITRKGNQNLEISYRDTDPERVQVVLEQLAQTYVEYSQECRSSACKGLEFVETQIPQIQQRVSDLREKVQQFHQQHGLKNLEAQVRLFSNRSVEISRQSAELKGKLADARMRYNELQTRMALDSNEALIQSLLKQDAQYQALLRRFKELDRQIILALSSYQAEDSTLQALNAEYNALVAQLNQEANQVLARYVQNPSADLQDPIFQEPQLLGLLQQSVATAHYIHILEVRQQTIEQAQQQITQRKQELATVLRQYADLRQQLQAETKILQEYVDQRNVFQAQTAEQDMTWQVTKSPELATDANGEPIPDYLHSLKEDFGSAAVFGALMGIAIAIVLQDKRNNASSRLRLIEPGY